MAPLSDAYASVETYRYVTGKTGISDDAEILTDLKAVSRYIEGKLGRFFTKDAAAATRVFSVPYSSDKLSVGDLAAVPTSIKIDTNNDGSFADETALAVTDYELHPINAPLRPEPWPYTDIVLTSWGTKGSWSAPSRVQVVSIFGWPAVPASIARATIHLAAILRLESPRATSRISEIEGTFEASREAQGIIKELMQQYKTYFFA